MAIVLMLLGMGTIPGQVSAQTLTVSPTKLQFAYSEAIAVRPQPISILINGGGAVQWTVVADKPWLVVAPSSGSGSVVEVTVTPADLAPGTYLGQVTITAPGTSGSPKSVPVTLTVPGPWVLLSTKEVTLALDRNGSGSAPIYINNVGGGRLNWQVVSNNAWLQVSPTSGTTPGRLQLSANLAGYRPGIYKGTATLSGSAVGGAPAYIAVTAIVSSGAAENFYVSPNGLSTGAGTMAETWDLATALAHPPAVTPGATIWLREGIYHGAFLSKLAGALGKPIVVRPYPGERAIIDTGLASSGSGLQVVGSDTWYWGLEIMSSNPERTTEDSGPYSAPNRTDGVDSYGPRNKFINLVVHDTAQGFGCWAAAVDNEISGSLIYYNGWKGGDRGHGHGIYLQNDIGKKVIQDNIQFYGFGMGIRGYGESASVKNVDFIGNISFNSGYAATGPANHWSNYLVTTNGGAEGITFNNNHSYHNTNEDGYSQLGWSFSGTERDLVAKDNFFIGGESAVEVWNWNQLTFTGNTLYSKNQLMLLLNTTSGQSTSNYSFSGNSYYGSGWLRFNGANVRWNDWSARSGVDNQSTYRVGRPTGLWTVVRPNKYDSGRANIVVYNWDLRTSVTVDVTGVLRSGQLYEIRDAMNFFGTPVTYGAYTGSPIWIPMTGLEIAPAIGNLPFAPRHTAPEFGVFVLLAK